MTGGPGATSGLGIGLAAHAFGYRGGFAGAGTPRAWPTPYDAYALMDLAAAHGLASVEIPGEWLHPSGPELARLRAYADERGLRLILASGVVQEETLRPLLAIAAELGVQTIRALFSSLLCGDRRPLQERWPEYLAEFTARLRRLRGPAEEAGVSIAVENHQDLTARELAGLCEELGSPHIGVTLDASNPLAVAEEPLAFAERVMPYLKHVHLKDYRIHPTPSGYRLVRCAVGHGVLDVPTLLARCAAGAPRATISIEVGALEARHIRFLEDDFWPAYPPRPLQELLPVLRLREARGGSPDEDWRTPWERGERGEPLAAYELEQFEASVAYLRTLAPALTARRA